MPTLIEIVNNAIVPLGDKSIASLEENTTAAIAVNTVYEQVRRELLALHPWGFALHSTELNALPTNPRVFGYDFAYELPSDYIRLMSVEGNTDYRHEGSTIVTNETTCKILYVRDMTSPSTWSSLFQSLITARLQEKIAFAITKDRAMVQIAQANYLQMLYRAQTIDSQQSTPEQLTATSSSLLAARS